MEREREVIDRIREFNRFYTIALGMLNRRFLDSEFSVTETRILFELSVSDHCTANFLTEKLHIDKSYLSRILHSFERRGLVAKRISPEDGRAFLIDLTDRGRQEASRLIERTNKQIGELIAPLSGEERARLCRAMDVVTEYLGGGKRQ